MNERYNEQDPAPQYDPEAARIRRALRAQKARRRKKMRSRRLFLLGVGGFGWHMPYLLLSSIVSAAVAGTVLVLLYRLFPDVVRQLMHRQKLARMVLENQWYEQAERTKQDGFLPK